MADEEEAVVNFPPGRLNQEDEQDEAIEYWPPDRSNEEEDQEEVEREALLIVVTRSIVPPPVPDPARCPSKLEFQNRFIDKLRSMLPAHEMPMDALFDSLYQVARYAHSIWAVWEGTIKNLDGDEFSGNMCSIVENAGIGAGGRYCAGRQIYILPRWGNTYVDEVRVLEVKKWLIAIAEENEFTTDCINKTKHVFSRLFSFGGENELIVANLNPVKTCNIRGVGRKSKSKNIVVPPEIAWKIAMSLPIMHRTLVLLAAATGMRMSELLGLRWGDIDFDSKTIVLNQTWVYGRIEGGKTEESRQPVVLGDRTTEFLLAWHRESPYAGERNWVFASSKLRGVRPISGSQFVKDYIRPRFVEHGLIDADYRGRAGLHAFRHSLATVLIVEEKVDPKTAQGILRHTDAALTMNIYTHAQDPAKRAALEKFEQRLV